jgi:hypothetical protein
MFSYICSRECIPFDQARKHVGEEQCVTGKIVRGYPSGCPGQKLAASRRNLGKFEELPMKMGLKLLGFIFEKACELGVDG